MSPQSGLLLDSCVVTELRGSGPHPAVVEFLRRRRHLRVYLSALTFGELSRPGLPDGQLPEVGGWLEELKQRFADNILPVDAEVAALWGPVSARAEVPAVRSLVAATALHKHLTVVSRHAEDYRKLAVPAVDPWQGEPEPDGAVRT
ncbi:PIN domain-containing protein [Arthrobacter mobilis]|uniref:Type II toxin-antitoxin system VapC family toxin n=1 Tax=Arthrobacter mobilis TaxID=2724944 RepID=A0A7X6K299_9MICC|nr:PIN domain-containing protein [Arthrobacter mobilis]NKX52957.1 type II toxin-antitoxin system VapC family toxin [Arthrobacter mobilis]